MIWILTSREWGLTWVPTKPDVRTLDLIEIGDRASHYLRIENNRRGRYVA